MPKDKVIITGVAGFIGSNLAKKLIDEGCEVIGIDNLSQGFLRNIEKLQASDRFSFLEADVRDHDQLTRQLSSRAINCIVHLAAYKIPRYGNALETLMVNTKGTESMLNIARAREAKFVFASTSDVYGKNPDLPFNEKANLVLGSSTVKRWAYATSKVFDEHLCFAYQESFGTRVSIIRFFGGYGPHQNTTWWGGPQSVFIDCAFHDKPMPLHGGGNQTRSFTYVDDMVNGIHLALKNPRADGEIFNIGNDREISIRELAHMVWGMIRDTEPKTDIIEYESLSKGYEDVTRRIPDLSKARDLLGYSATVQLEEGLPVTIDWQRSISG